MKKYSRVTYEVRCQIEAYLQAGFSKSEIAKKVGHHKSTIYREIQRNLIENTYNSLQAHSLSKTRYKSCRKPYKFQGEIKDQVIRLIKDELSPEQASGRLSLELSKSISHECIYQHIRRNKDKFEPFMRRMWKKGRGRYLQRKDSKCSYFYKISQRPHIADERGRLGDWERDTMLFKNKKPILVCVDRKSRFTKIGKTESLKADLIEKLTEQLLCQDGMIVNTITNDRGTEFNYGTYIPNVPTFHCDPQRPQQRGTVENTIGLLRRYFKKKTDLKDISDEYINYIEFKLNTRPRKVLNYLTPYEVYFNKRVALAN